jgi:hypothetical protein
MIVPLFRFCGFLCSAMMDLVAPRPDLSVCRMGSIRIDADGQLAALSVVDQFRCGDANSAIALSRPSFKAVFENANSSNGLDLMPLAARFITNSYECEARPPRSSALVMLNGPAAI